MPQEPDTPLSPPASKSRTWLHTKADAARRWIRKAILSGRVTKRTAETLQWTGFATAAALLFVFVLEKSLQEAPLLITASAWTEAAFVSSVVSILLSMLVGLNRLHYRWVLYAIAVPCVISIFCIIVASGGLTQSPFITLYPALMTVVIIISERPRPVIYVGCLVSMCLVMNAVMQYNHQQAVTVFQPALSDVTYLFKYSVIIILAITILGIADWKSQKAGAPATE